MDMTDAPDRAMTASVSVSVSDELAWMGLRWRVPDPARADEAAQRLGFESAPARGHWMARADGAWLLNLSGYEWLLGAMPAVTEGLLVAWHKGLDDAAHGGTAPEVYAFDQADRWIRCTVSGAGARALLAQGCGLDLRAEHFLPGHVAATLFARVDAVLACAADDEFHLLVERPLGDYLHRWLCAAVDAHFARRSP